MATVNIILRTDRANKKGDCPLYLRITKDRRSRYISLRQSLPAEYWDEEKQLVKKGYPHATRLNAQLAKRKTDALGQVLIMEEQDRTIPSQEIKANVMGKPSIDFFAFAAEYLERKRAAGKTGVYRNGKASVRKLQTFWGKPRMFFEQLTVSVLKRFEHYCLGELGNKHNTYYSDLKDIRRIYNEAILEDLVPFEKSPFLRYKFKWEKTKRDYLTEGELSLIEALAIPPTSKMAIHQDMFIFACYAAGIRISDMLRLHWRDFDGTHIRYKMVKTKELVAIKLPQTALAILHKYRERAEDPLGDGFIFPVLKEDWDSLTGPLQYNAVSSATTLVNKSLKAIAQKAGIGKRLSSHVARHTWATRALGKGMNIAHVSKLLGHANLRTTQIYLNIINEELDNAMDIFD